MVGRVSVFLLVAASLASGGIAAYSAWQVHGHASQSEWLSQKGRSEGEGYVTTLSPEYAASQLDTFDRRRLVVAETARWRRLQLISLLGVVLFGFAAYVVRTLRAIRTLEDGLPPAPTERAAQNAHAR